MGDFIKQLKEFVDAQFETNEIYDFDKLLVATKEFFKFGVNRLIDEEFIKQLELLNRQSNKSSSRNGLIQKNVSSIFGRIDIDIPKDRDNKTQIHLTNEINKEFSFYIMLLYSQGISLSQIQYLLFLLYHHDYSKYSLKAMIESHLKLHERIIDKNLPNHIDHIIITSHYFKKIDKKYLFFLSKNDTTSEVIGFYEFDQNFIKTFSHSLSNLMLRGLRDISFITADLELDAFKVLHQTFKHTIIQVSVPEFIKNESRKVANIELQKKYQHRLKMIFNNTDYDSAIKKYNDLIHSNLFKKDSQFLYQDVEHLFQYKKMPLELQKKYYSVHSFNPFKKRLNKSLDHLHIHKMDLIYEYIDFSIQDYTSYLKLKI